MQSIGPDALKGRISDAYQQGVVSDVMFPIVKTKLPAVGSSSNDQGNFILPPGGNIGAQFPRWILPVAAIAGLVLLLSTMKPLRASRRRR